MAKKSPGLQKRGRLWWIDKRLKGFGRLCESCGTDRLSEAEQYLARRQEEIRNALAASPRSEEPCFGSKSRPASKYEKAATPFGEGADFFVFGFGRGERAQKSRNLTH